MNVRSNLLAWMRWDLILILAGLVVLGAVGIYVWGAPSGSPLYTFDFGTSSSTDLASGAIKVEAGGSVYPQSSGPITFGWNSGSLVQAVSRGSSVTDKLLRDYNFAPATDATFKFRGLAAGDYELRFHVGDSEGTVSTKVTVQGRSASMTKTNTFGLFDVPIQVASASDDVSMVFTSASGAAGWAINAIEVFESSAAVADPSFTLAASPTEQTVRAGGVVQYGLTITPIEGYASPVDISISGLTAGITAELADTHIDNFPATTTLTITTDESVATLPYEFLVRAKGGDSQNITKSVVVKLTVISSDASEPANNGPLTQVEGQDQQSPAAVRQQFRLIDEYVAAEAQKIVTRNNMGEIRDVANDFTAFPVAPDLPEPTNGVERSLQFLTRTGIIGTAVSNAPRGEEDTGPKGFWRRLIDGLAQPLGG